MWNIGEDGLGPQNGSVIVWEASMLGRFVLLTFALALLSPVVLVSDGSHGDDVSDTQKGISVVIRHCTS